jgi:NADH:ubiquinone oxidoreductase subunit 5 (subunit L)/multisubunit Na+/H+ antiporter MnhA subunit
MVYQGVINMGSANTVGAGLWPVWLLAAMFGSALTLASFVKLIHSVFLSRLPSDMKETKEVSFNMTVPMIVLAVLCVLFGVFYRVPLEGLIYPALGIESGAEIFTGIWDSSLATVLIVIGIIVGLLILAVGFMARKVRIVPTWTCGEVMDNDDMIIPGTHFYKTVSSMGGFKQFYSGQEKGYFDLYDQCGKLGQYLTGFLRWLHSGILGQYLMWVMLGLLAIIFIICKNW